MKTFRGAASGAAFIMAAVGASAPALAQASDVYAGKTLTVLVGLAASAADALLRPALRRLCKRAQARRDQKRDLYADGGGI